MDTSNYFWVDYTIKAASKKEAASIAESIRIEQSVEMPLETVPEPIKPFLPAVQSLAQREPHFWDLRIRFPKSIVGGDPTQFLNVLYGNISLLQSIQINDVSDSAFSGLLQGPAFGIEGIRKILDIKSRPIGCTALKPVGLSAAEFAERVYQFSKGGIDIIKDDHGLTNQPSCPFRDRVTACAEAARKGEQVSGKRTLYFPNITTSPAKLVQRFEEAVELGADGVLIAPQLTGLEAMHAIGKMAHIPIMAHPAFSGPYVMNPGYGFSMELYFAKLWRAFGADAIIYPNAGGRFTFSEETCKLMNSQMRSPFCGFKPSFPVPAGGMQLHTISAWIEKYGNETLFLIGGNLYKQKEGIENAASTFQKMLEKNG